MKRSLLACTYKMIWLMLLVVVLLNAAPAHATTWTVTSLADSATDTTTLRGAINAAADLDIIDLSQVGGTIVLTLGEIGVSKRITISGPGASQLAISGNNTSRVFHFQSGGDNAALEGVTLEYGNGNISSTLPDNNGGAVRIFEGFVIITGCVFVDNSAEYGGAIYVFPGASAGISGDTFVSNSAEYGGAIYSDVGPGTNPFENLFASNSASIAGGAIYFAQGTYDFNNNTISGNTSGAINVQGSGAGMYLASGVLIHMQHDIVSGNSIVTTAHQTQPGGSGITNFGTLTANANTFSGNTGNAGSIWNSGTLNLGDATFSGNDTAIFNEGTADVDFTTIAMSSANGIVNASGGSLTLQNTILAENSGNCVNNGTFTSADFNLSDDTTCEGVLTQAGDLNLAPAGLDPAGLKPNGNTNPDPGNLTEDTIALEPGSAAVNAITVPSDCVDIPPFGNGDERGVSRPQGTYCDIGAYEATPDFYFSPIPTITANVGGAGSVGVGVNSFVEFSAPVSLTVSAVPSGLTASFSVDPVTPPVDGTVSPSLTVNVGPSVTPGTYSFSVVGTSPATGGFSGLLTHSAQVNVSVQTSAASLTQVINDDRSLGCMSTGVSVTLTVEVLVAQAAARAGLMQLARDTLNVSLLEIKDAAGKQISTTCTDSNGNQFSPAQSLTSDVEVFQAAL